MNFFKKLFAKKKPPELPTKIEVIEKELYLIVAEHEIDGLDSQQGLHFLTEGLYAQGQKELLATFINTKIPLTDLIDVMSRWADTVYFLAKQGRIVDAGGFTEFSQQQDLLGWYGAVYKESQQELDTPTIDMILLTMDEVRAVQTYGALRILSMLGKSVTYYPTPYWTDFERYELPIAEMVEKSILLEFGQRVMLPSTTVTKKEECVIWRIPRDIGFDISPAFEHYLITLFPSLAKHADGCFTFSLDDSIGPNAITPPDSLGKEIGACFLTLWSVDNEQHKAKIAEDGIILFFTKEQWEHLVLALKNKKDFKVDDDTSLSFHLKWVGH